MKAVARFLCMAALLLAPLAPVPASEGTAPPVYELRTYRIPAANKAHFHARFRDQCIPIMKKYGFDIVFTADGGTPEAPEFVYLLRWKDEGTKVAMWRAFLADPDWIRIKRETAARYGTLVEDTASEALALTDYSPPLP
ncbi:MAG: NIPSNAP family protein [Sphingomonas sp.]|nr:NIPSNAP family protein [Sphingomonas sp.]MDX3885628.1 NIPSNAP family protein [Sphingomonas sp.]